MSCRFDQAGLERARLDHPASRVAPSAASPAGSGLRPVATALLLCLGMLVIPLIALGASGGAAARGVAADAGRNRQGASGPTHTGSVANGAASATPATLLGVEAAAVVHASPAIFTSPLAVAVAAPIASAPVAARSALLARRPTTTAAPTHTAPKVVAVAPHPTAPLHLQLGKASWYYAPRGTCAHPNLPFGTVLTLVDVATGRTATCRVDDRGPYAGGRVVDLSPDVFARLEALGDGVATVRITW